MKRIALIILSLLAGAVSAFAQNSIRVDAPSVVGADEQFNVTFIIEGENAPSDFQWNPSADFQLVWGPQRGTSTSISVINGKKTKNSQTTYTYVLMPKKTGTFQLGQATATVKGNTISSGNSSIEVVSNGSSQRQQSSGSRQDSGSASATGDVSAEDLFLRLSLSRTSAVVGETITATLKLYQRVNIAGFEDAKFPTFNGFWSQELQAPTNIEFQRESLNDKIYNSAVLRSWTLIPQQSGDIKIDPAELVCLVNVRTATSISNSIFDSFFQDDYRTIRKRVYSDAYTVHVSALPSGAPDSFCGGVGTFSMTAAVTKDSLKAHDASSLVVTVSGKGNVSLLEAPKINFPPDFEVYDVKTSETGGSKTFEYPFIPRSHGEFVLGPVQFSYYDISSRKYVTLSSQQMEVKVAPSAASASASASAGQMVSSVNRKDVKDLGSDIRYIASRKPSFSKAGHSFFGSAAFWIIALLILAATAATYAALRGMAARKADVVGAKNRAASKMAKKKLAQAGEFLNKNLYTAYYEELHKALLGYVSDKLNMDFADMSKENIAEVLKSRGVNEGLASEFTGLLDACEFARYSPDSGHEAMSAHYESALNVISSIDSSMRVKTKNTVAGTAAAALLLMSVPWTADAAAVDYPDSLWAAGTEAYAAGQWKDAADSWQSICDLGIESADLYYNMGNAFFKMDDYAHAILYYERAKRLDPSNKDIEHNLAFANGFIQDKIEVVPEFFLSAWCRKVCWKLSVDAWAVLFLVFLAAVMACVLTFLLSARPSGRKTGFYGGIAMLLVAIICFSFAMWQHRDAMKNESAIITRAVSSVKSSPGSEAAKDLFVLHEGTKVRLIDEVGGWRNIELPDGRQGWISGSDIEVI